MHDLLLDLRQAVRAYAKQPGLVAAILLTLSLGIGANTAIFTVAYGVLLKPLSYPEPERLVSLWPETTADKMIAEAVSERTRSFSAVAAYAERDFTVGADGDPAVVKGAQVGPRLFDVLGSPPLLGRAFAPGESRPGQNRVVVLGYGLWRSRYGGDPGVVGRTIDIDGDPYRVVGVMPASFQPLHAGWEMYTPIPVDPGNAQDFLGSFYLQLVGRLKPGVSPEQAGAELARLAAGLREEYPNLMTDEKVKGARVAPLHEHLVGKVRPTLLVLLGAAGVVLMIACANVANLLLARASHRRREVAVRSALGATPGRVTRQVLTESLVLGLLGGAGGLAIAAGAARVMAASLPAEMPRATEVGLNLPVLAFALGASLLSALLFGMAPARRLSSLELQTELREEGGGGSSLGRRGRRSGQALVVVQVAAATVLLISAGLLLKSLSRLQSVDPGFRTEGLYALRTDLAEPRYPDGAGKTEFYRRLLERVRAVPGVSAAGGIHLLPLTSDNWNFPYLAQDNPVPANASPGTALPDADFRVVTPDYFRTAEIPLLRGRAFTESDHAEAPAVGIINRTMAARLWPGSDPVGKTIQLFGDGGPVFTVVGVVDDIHPDRLDAEPRPTMYRPFAQWPNGSMYLMVRASTPWETLAPMLRAAARDIDPGVPVSQMQPMSAVVRTSVAGQRFTGALVGAFAGLALLLALAGIYSVISYATSRRTREIGIRMALGARWSYVFGGVLGEGLRLAAVGVAGGLALALAAGRLLSSRLYEVSGTDATTFLLTVVLVSAAVLVSCCLPAWRAVRVDPVKALRSE
jgi:putative ABC transport system permease protein